ncbi:MAG: hypothetical protein QG597_2348 [Actinomycetota bacterium]|nr:hypothetical protein [Actinomycetota bacterium]
MTGEAPPPTWFREWAERTGHVFFKVRIEPGLTVDFISESVLELTGFSAAELIAQPTVLMDRLLPPHNADSLGEAIADGRIEIDVEFGFHHRGGHPVRAHLVAGVHRLAGAGVVVEGIAYDITSAHEARERAEQSEEWFRLSFEKSMIGMCVVAPGGRFLMCNQALCQMLGRDEAELTQQTWLEVTYPPDVQVDLDLVNKVLAGESSGFQLLKRFVRSDGAIVWGDLTTAVLNDSQGQPSLWISQVVDVTARIEAEQALAASEEKYRLLAENVSDIVLHLDAGRVQWVSPSLKRSLGWDPRDWVGRPVAEFHHPDDVTRVQESRARLRGGETPIVRVRVLAADGTYHWVAGHAAAYRAPSAGADESVVSLRVIDADVAREQELDRRANYDELTGLLTRRALFDSFDLLQERASASAPKHMAALFCDLDDFKRINDTYGHSFGDEVLRTVAQRLLGVIRQGDLGARMGGDEVLVVLHNTAHVTEAQTIAERIRTELAEPIDGPSGQVRVTASIGVAMVRPGESADDLIARADAAMYQAKRSRGAGVVAVE